MNIKFSGQKTVALAELSVGESLLFPCNNRTVQSVQSSIQSLYPKRGKNSKEFRQKKALLIFDENVLPQVVIVVTRHQSAIIEVASG